MELSRWGFFSHERNQSVQVNPFGLDDSLHNTLERVTLQPVNSTGKRISLLTYQLSYTYIHQREQERDNESLFKSNPASVRATRRKVVLSPF